jgi:apolipoprotein N-acyltransferase
MDRTKTDRGPAAGPAAPLGAAAAMGAVTAAGTITAMGILTEIGILIAMAAGSAALLLFSFPPFDANFLAFAALVPVLLVVYASSLSRTLAAGIVCGFLFFCLHLFWVNAYLPVVGVIFVTVVYGGCMAACFLVLNLAAGAFPAWKAVITPFVWVGVEYGRSFGFLGMTFGSLGYTQHNFPRLIQVADIGGEPLVSFIVVLFNAGLAQLILSAAGGRNPSPLFRGAAGLTRTRPRSWRPEAWRPKAIWPLAAASTLLVAGLLYGTFKLREPLPEGPSVKLALIQALSSPRETWKDEKWATLTRLIGLTEESLRSHPDVDIVVWTETAIRTSLGPNLAKGTPYHAQIREFVKRHGRGFIIGSPDNTAREGGARGDSPPVKPDALSDVRPDDGSGQVWTNSAYYLGPDGAIAGKYDKIKLTPFGEHFPLGRRLPFLQKVLDRFTDSAGFTPGTQYTVFNHDKLDFGVVICWEGMYPYMIRRFVRRGARFIVNISNDMWTNTRAAHEQHFTVTKFRAVENRIWFVRAGNDGVTAFVNPRGEVAGVLPIGEAGSLVGEAGPKAGDTFYTKHGDILPALGLAALALSLAASVSTFIRRL